MAVRDEHVFQRGRDAEVQAAVDEVGVLLGDMDEAERLGPQDRKVTAVDAIRA